MSKKVLTPEELDLKDFKDELKGHDKAIAANLKSAALARKDILKDIAKAERLIAKQKAKK